MKAQIAVLSSIVLLLPALQAAPPLVAVLEYPQCAHDSVLAVRPLFAHVDDRWIPLSSADSASRFDMSNMEWTVAFDGNNRGTVRTTDPRTHFADDWFFARDRRLDVAMTPAPPRIANTRHAFSGWCSAPPTRPLVLVSPANYRDPDHWQRFDAPSSIREELFADFKRVVDTTWYCPKDPEKAIPFPYTAKHIAMRAAYRDRRGRRLIALQLDFKDGCDGMSGDDRGIHWFFLDHGTRYIGNGLELVDAGDYDADGASEILFWSGGYDRDGYSLYYDDLRRHADFTWGYH